MRTLSLMLIVMLALGCARMAPRTSFSPDQPTIVIENKGLDRIVLFDDTGHAIGRVMIGEARCIRLRAVTTQAHLAILIEGALHPIPAFNPYDFNGGWYLLIGTTPSYDVNNIRPMGRCVRW